MIKINLKTLINALRKTDPYIEAIFTNGSCYQFYKFLKVLYIEAEPYFYDFNKDHIVTK